MKKLLRDKVKRDTYMVNKVCGMISRGDLRNDHPQQRKSDQWGDEVRDNFIVTVLQNEDFDPIKICEQLTENGVVLWLIDGLQRCTTIENYKSGKFALGKKINPSVIEYQEVKKDENGKIVKDADGNMVYENVAFDLKGKSYAQLPERLKEDFNNCPVEVVKHLDCSDEEVGRHIVRYNSGVKMNVAQKTITYMCKVAKDVKKLSGHAFFSDCASFSDIKDRNGTIDKIVNETIMGLNFFDRWTKDATKLGKFLNENASKEMFNNLNEYLDRLYNIVTPTTGKLFSEKNALVWFMLFDKFVKTGLPDEKFGEFLNNFEKLKNAKVTLDHDRKPKGAEETNTLSFAEIDTCNSTKDKSMIEDKLHILETVMGEFLGVDFTNLCKIETLGDNTTPETAISSDEEYPDEDGMSDVSAFDFIKRNVNSEATEEDVDVCYETIDYCKNKLKGFDKNSKLLDYHNDVALVAVIAYAIKNEIDLDKWIVSFSNQNNTYPSDTKENYTYMLNSLKQFTNNVAA